MARFRSDLYRGTSEAYARFRPPYPPALLADLRDRVPLGPGSRVLDLACGTGQVALGLAADGVEVWAVDQEPEAAAQGVRLARSRRLPGISWITAPAERVALEGRFDLVAIGNAFHRLDREVVAARLVPHLVAGGCVALLWGGSPWEGDRPWQRTLGRVLDRWTAAVGASDRVPEGWQEEIRRLPHAEVLRQAGLVVEDEARFSVAHRWSVETLIGFAHSTSFLNRVALGDRAEAFAADLASELLACCPDGVFAEELSFTTELARRPMSPVAP